jgi:hypothetical protein
MLKDNMYPDRRDSRIVPASTSLSLSMCPLVLARLEKILPPPLGYRSVMVYYCTAGLGYLKVIGISVVDPH